MFGCFGSYVFNIENRLDDISDNFDNEGYFSGQWIFVGWIDNVLSVEGSWISLLIGGMFFAVVELDIFLMLEVDVLVDEFLDIFVVWVILEDTFGFLVIGCFEKALCSAIDSHLMFGHIWVERDGSVVDGCLLPFADR